MADSTATDTAMAASEEMRLFLAPGREASVFIVSTKGELYCMQLP